MGARPMGRLIQDKLKKAIAEDILFGKLANGGGEVVVLAEDGQIVLKMISQLEKKERVGKPLKEVST
jgi:ATP-dependent Clp protease ATP-binding subunit ClpA